MKVISIKEQPDESVIVELEMNVEEQKLFIEVGVVYCLEESLKKFVPNEELEKGGDANAGD